MEIFDNLQCLQGQHQDSLQSEPLSAAQEQLFEILTESLKNQKIVIGVLATPIHGGDPWSSLY